MIETSGHLPECPWVPSLDDYEACICDRLRACEQRVMAQFVDGVDEVSYRRGLDAAREAVAAYANERLALTKHPNMSEDITAALRVAASRIDALRGSGNPDTPPSAEKGEQPFDRVLAIIDGDADA